MRFGSILFREVSGHPQGSGTSDWFRDLNLDQIVADIANGKEWKQYDLAAFFHMPLRDEQEVVYRQQVMQDLQDSNLGRGVRVFSQRMRTMRECSDYARKDTYKHEQQRWFLRSAEVYLLGIEGLCHALTSTEIKSAGMQGLEEFLGEYVQTASYRKFAGETKQITSDLAALRYNLRIEYGRITVSQCGGEIDYSAAIQTTFAKFRRGAVKSYRAKLQKPDRVNHIQANVLERVARLFPDTFKALDVYCAEHTGFLDPVIARFDREVQFYMAYLAYMERFRAMGLRFCYPRVSRTSKQVLGRDAFDLAMAASKFDGKSVVVTNDFSLSGPERIIVVSGPNQGGKSTFARMFGQMHYLAALGCPVPGTEANLFLFDHIYCHFEKEETITNLRGKLQDDLLRIRQILDSATADSIVILNELFSSTTLKDAVYLAKKIMARLSQIDLLGVWVTFMTELSRFDEKTISVVSMVDPENPASRTFKLQRKPAEDLAYALAVAQKYDLTYERVKERIQP